MTAEAAFDTPNYAATSARLAEEKAGEEKAADEQPKAVETPEQRAQRARRETADEIEAMSAAYRALHQLTQAQLARAFTWLHNRLERTRPDPWGDEPPF